MSFTVFIWTLDAFSLSFSPVLVPNYFRIIFFCMVFFLYFCFCVLNLCKQQIHLRSIKQHFCTYKVIPKELSAENLAHLGMVCCVSFKTIEEAAFRRAADFEVLYAIPVLTTSIAFCDFTTDLAKIKEKHQLLYGTDPNLLRSYCCAADGSYRQAQKNPQFPRQHQEGNKTWSVVRISFDISMLEAANRERN